MQTLLKAVEVSLYSCLLLSNSFRGERLQKRFRCKLTLKSRFHDSIGLRRKNKGHEWSSRSSIIWCTLSQQGSPAIMFSPVKWKWQGIAAREFAVSSHRSRKTSVHLPPTVLTKEVKQQRHFTSKVSVKHSQFHSQLLTVTGKHHVDS